LKGRPSISTVEARNKGAEAEKTKVSTAKGKGGKQEVARPEGFEPSTVRLEGGFDG
jgi:hypothetical protein